MKTRIDIRLDEAVSFKVLAIDTGGRLPFPARVKVEYVMANNLPVVRWLQIDESLVLNLGLNYDFN